MRRVIAFTLLTMALVGLSAASGAAAVAPASITVTSAAIDATSGGVIIHIQNAAGWHRDGGDVTSACTASADVTGTDSQPYTLTDPDTTNPDANGLNGMLLLPTPMPSGVVTAPGPITVTASCHLKRISVRTRIVTTRQIKPKRPGGYSTRVVTPFVSGGNCRGHGPDGSGGQIFTCLAAKEAVTYQFMVGRGATNIVATHTVTGGIAPCRGKAWRVRRNPTHRRHVAVIFSHGSRNDFSQCDVTSLSLRFTVSHRVTTSTVIRRHPSTTFTGTLS